ncbi:MAG: ABC transporter permease [Acetobacteraceae bacterium]|nr:ABC transporter permease [Acetobacteraceae bacterium]
MNGQPTWGTRLVAALGIGALAFLVLPLLIVVPMSFSSARSLAFPPPGFSLRWYETFFGDPSWMEALWNSLTIASISSVCATTLGGLAAYGLRRGTFRGRDVAESNFMAPLIVPTIIAAVAMYLAFAGVNLLGTFLGLVIAHTVLSVPLVIMVLGVAVRSFDVRIEQVGWSLGGSWFYTARTVLLPNIAPSVFAAWIFAFIGSFDEVIVTSFIGGTYETIPKKMFNELILQVNPTITAIATLLMLFTVVTLALTAWMLQRAGRLRSTLL